jgi:carbon monoxide dehydrogenase subunit G
VPTARASRTVSASVDDLWELISDPHHMPRWWPRVERVEGVDDTGAFTEVLRTEKGKTVRADFSIVEQRPPLGGDDGIRRWSQELVGTPFERLLTSSETSVRLHPLSEQQTEVTIEIVHSTRGFFNRLGGRSIVRAARKIISEALDGLDNIFGA